LLSYSVLSCCDLILIPVNPDFFASKGTNLILNTLRMRIEPFPLPRIGVFMNKTKTWSGSPTNESAFYMREVERVCAQAAATQKIDARFFKAWIPERVGVKRAITAGGVPSELVDPFKRLWTEAVEFML
jgi:chromosome partitioning protein